MITLNQIILSEKHVRYLALLNLQPPSYLFSILCVSGVLVISISLAIPRSTSAPNWGAKVWQPLGGDLPSVQTGRPAPCYIELPKIFLVFENVRHHINDWPTFLNLGYKQSDIVQCGDAANYPEGEPITNLLKGSGDEVYLMKSGVRHHIPDMFTFNALGYQVADITIVPDYVLTWWPLGNDLPSCVLTQSYFDNHIGCHQLAIGTYTITIWTPGTTLNYHGTISAPNQPDIVIPGAFDVVQTPDVTGDGFPVVMFSTNVGGGSTHCCAGTVVYELGTTPTQILFLQSPPDDYVGTGEFKDLAGDGRYEFLTEDPVGGCSDPAVQVVLEYDPNTHQFVGATPHYAAYFGDLFARLTDRAATTGDPCDVNSLITTLLYFGREVDARNALNQYYKGDDAEAFWKRVKAAAEAGPHYVALSQ